MEIWADSTLGAFAAPLAPVYGLPIAPCIAFDQPRLIEVKPAYVKIDIPTLDLHNFCLSDSPDWEHLGDKLIKIAEPAVQPVMTSIPVSGQILEQVEHFRAQMDLLKKELAAAAKLSTWRMLTGIHACSEALAPMGSPLHPVAFASVEPWLESHWSVAAKDPFRLYSGHLPPRPVYPLEAPPQKVSQLFELLFRRLRRRLSKLSAKIRRTFVTTPRWFCGLDWSQRAWFLLHGSRPPRLAALPA